MNLYRFLADVVVVIHFAFIAFVIGGMGAILVGIALRRRWARNFWFRALHLAAITIVVLQALAGVICPLTTLEDYLRVRGGEEGYPGSFIGYWVHELIFYQGPPWVFAVCYCLFGLAVLAAFLLAPPEWPWGAKSLTNPGSLEGRAR